ncbi:hypothetical protein O181_022490 [Austropuccinia psidii MF-1]|uniref:Peptidase M20 dimerisation domain-containing protein n=1 Tax=Austropuccinia psidii MF-1 TaxID=1389203 RepID=A0A9Q3CHH1_9BASI|nr:hypothetical protein [Austropuccinia psidii MF-1]
MTCQSTRAPNSPPIKSSSSRIYRQQSTSKSRVPPFITTPTKYSNSLSLGLLQIATLIVMDSMNLLTTLSSQDKESIMSLVSDYEVGNVFGGSQSGDIHVWSLYTFFPITRLVGHQSSVLCLTISIDRSLLFSSSGDNTVRVWDSRQFGNALYIVKPPNDNCGDVLSLAWCSRLNMLYLGCQDASIQWISLQCLKTHSLVNSSKNIEHDSNSKLHSGSLSPETSFIPELAGSSISPLLTTDGISHLIPSACSSPHLHSCRPVHHKFFDSLSQADLLKAARRRDSNYNLSPQSRCQVIDSRPGFKTENDQLERFSTADSIHVEGGIEVLFIENKDSISYAHFGYTYSLLLVNLNDQPFLVSGSGDATIKIWTVDLQTGALIRNSSKLLSATLSTHLSPSNPCSPGEEDLGAVLTLAAYGPTLYAGYQDGIIKIWDLDTFTCIRTLFHRESSLSRSINSKTMSDVLTITVLDNGEMFSGCSNGLVIRWDPSFHRVCEWVSHQGSALASCFISRQAKRLLLTGGSDNCIKVWDVSHANNMVSRLVSGEMEIKDPAVMAMAFQDRMFRHLSQFVSYRSISNDAHREECRQAALYLKKTLVKLGALAQLLPGEPGRNPLVLARFDGKSSSPSPTTSRRKRVLYYGHYDVVQAGDEKDWKAPAFVMTGRNGWLYGRGVSDNKGPTLAVAYAVTTLLEQRALDVDVVMLVEGEEEAGSAGFQKIVIDNKVLIGDIDVVLVSNSCWLGEETPCMTFGLRGVIHATVSVTSQRPNLHSGIHGGATHEPVLDLVRILGALVGTDGRIQLDGFYSGVRPIHEEEDKLYNEIVDHLTKSGNVGGSFQDSPITDIKEYLLAKWRQPALSLHKIDVTGPAHATVIPSSAQSAVSIRIVPDQSLEQIASSLEKFLQAAFKSLNSSNTLQVEINHTADWWLGDPKDAYSVAIGDCVEEEWGTKPLWIREGGSIPSVPFLEDEFNAKAIHLPMGSASDSAHLSNERIKMLNLEKGSNVVAKFLKKIAKI